MPGHTDDFEKGEPPPSNHFDPELGVTILNGIGEVHVPETSLSNNSRDNEQYHSLNIKLI